MTLTVSEMGRKGGTASAAALTADQRSARASAAGKASAARLTPEQRSQRARKAVQARWAQCRALAPDAITRCALRRGHEGDHADCGLHWT
jgi:hypothetical protein